MNNPNYLVQVRCLTYNHAAYITDTMNGFCMQQTEFPYICIIFDDNSTDGEQDVIKQYLEKKFIMDGDTTIMRKETDDYVLICTRHKTNKNCYFAVYFLKYNHYQLHKSRVPHLLPEWNDIKYLALCEGDDYWTDPYKLQKQVDALEAHPECSICFAKVATITSDGNLQRRIHPSFSIPTIFELSDFVKWEFGDSGWVFHTSCFLYRKNVILDYNEALNTKFKGFPHGDLIIQLHCLHHGKGYFIPDFVSCYRTLSGGYNSYVMNHVEFAINENNKKIQGLKNYDNCTNFQFHSILKKAMLSIELKNAKLTEKRFAPFDCKYFYLYKQSSFKDVTCFFLDYYFPNLLRLLVTIKHIILK